MAQDYKVLQFKKGDFQDDHGNYWCDMALEGVGEPVRIVVKDPTQFHSDMTLYGTIEDKVSRAGKDYLKFKREKREEQTEFHDRAGGQKAPQTQDDGYWDDKNAQIRAQWAIGQAVNFTGPENSMQDIENAAKTFFAMVDRVKGSNGLKAEGVKVTPIESQDDLTKRPLDNVLDVTDAPINLDDIPF